MLPLVTLISTLFLCYAYISNSVNNCWVRPYQILYWKLETVDSEFPTIFAFKRIGFSLPSSIYKYWLRFLLSLLQDKVIQLFLPFFIWQILQDPYPLCPGCTSWMYTSMSMSFLYWGAQNTRQYSRCDLTGAEGKVHLSQPAGTGFPNTEIVDFHCHMGTLLSHAHLLAHWDPPHTLRPGSFPLVGPKVFTSAHRCFSLGEDHVFPFAELYFSSLSRSHLVAAQQFLFLPTHWGSPQSHHSGLWGKMAPISRGVHN